MHGLSDLICVKYLEQYLAQSLKAREALTTILCFITSMFSQGLDEVHIIFFISGHRLWIYPDLSLNPHSESTPSCVTWGKTELQSPLS